MSFGRLDFDTTDPQPVIGERVRHEVIELFGVGHRAVRPEVGGDVLPGELGARVPAFSQPHNPADHERAGALHQTGVPDGVRRGHEPGDRQDGHRENEQRKPLWISTESGPPATSAANQVNEEEKIA